MCPGPCCQVSTALGRIAGNHTITGYVTEHFEKYAQVTEIEEILSESRFNDLLGIAESHRLEFKSQPYDLQQTKQQHELAKDVSALANSEGGCIVVGIKTKKDFCKLLLC